MFISNIILAYWIFHTYIKPQKKENGEEDNESPGIY